MSLWTRWFGTAEPTSPVGLAEERWILKTLVFLLNSYHAETPLNNGLLLPEPQHFPDIHASLNQRSADDTVRTVCRWMHVSPEEITVIFERKGHCCLSEGVLGSGPVYIQSGSVTAGTYCCENGVHTIRINVDVVTAIPALVSTFSHELAHYKLLGQTQIQEDSEYVTDLLPLCYGFGLFRANSACNHLYTYEPDRVRPLPRASGYMTQEMYGFALAVHAALSGYDPKQARRYLRSNVKDVFRQAMTYVAQASWLPGMRKYVCGQ